MLKDTIQNGDKVEICPKSMILMNSFSELISKIGGGVLVVDYGETFGFSDSVRVGYLVITGYSQSQVYPERNDSRVPRPS